MAFSPQAVELVLTKLGPLAFRPFVQGPRGCTSLAMCESGTVLQSIFDHPAEAFAPLVTPLAALPFACYLGATSNWYGHSVAAVGLLPWQLLFNSLVFYGFLPFYKFKLDWFKQTCFYGSSGSSRCYPNFPYIIELMKLSQQRMLNHLTSNFLQFKRQYLHACSLSFLAICIYIALVGCELVKSLVLNGFKRISVVDHDRITLSNLNRQFLFRPCDVNKFKAQVVCEYLNRYALAADSITTSCPGGTTDTTADSRMTFSQAAWDDGAPTQCAGRSLDHSPGPLERRPASPANSHEGTSAPIGDEPISAKCYCCKVQQLELETLSQFDVVFSAVDSVTARRWLNWALFQIVDRKQQPGGPSRPDSTSQADLGTRDPAGREIRRCSRTVLIDGGSQGLYGHVRVVSPFSTPCVECTLGMFSPEPPLPCLLTALRTPEDCVRHALSLQLEAPPDHASDAHQVGPELLLDRVYECSRELAEVNRIAGVTRDLVDRICNRSTPNVATTNSVVASLMVNALLTRIRDGATADNFYFYTGRCSTGLTKFSLEPDVACTVCGSECMDLKTSRRTTLRELLSTLSLRLNSEDLNLLSDEVAIAYTGTIYLGAPASLRDAYRHRLDTRLSDIVAGSCKIYVTSSTGRTTWVVNLTFTYD
ncbi:NEDD8-activating enzyme E1 catalytic subunit [Theileria orientalis strain Shintoku]|uniref:NEDD8-activating enzyme E1 catalytic subunit n=1 Tax=Theileria orientalis strain Shintoku TaxID=869250 RepID=J4CCB6_THEOR|nr:NEDD8-activating enzyme E1 catalytic subunit [Theileria orientalis strain Shintoku]BAM39107.1 NEDD8-activating enzyme E1 catalytic subunit [Theileria orientalis strain Shintoku]|eukprot:XP_009689408.1 NEDD8-activating enzyme E1 catalytic subunit [Theileria orientalis strain Shintoku]